MCTTLLTSCVDDAVRGEAFVKMPIKRQPYGDWEFEVRDPNGYVLVFGGE
jgi:uncharacterized glyoxalase superfamily protein PhnB